MIALKQGERDLWIAVYAACRSGLPNNTEAALRVKTREYAADEADAAVMIMRDRLEPIDKVRPPSAPPI